MNSVKVIKYFDFTFTIQYTAKNNNNIYKTVLLLQEITTKKVKTSQFLLFSRDDEKVGEKGIE